MEFMKLGRAGATAAAAACLVLAACADNRPDAGDTVVTTPPATADTVGGAVAMTTMSDANIVDLLTTANTGEVEYSKVAVTKATNPEVKQFARDMVRDHEAMVKSINGLASKLAVTPAPPEKSQALKDEVAKDINDLNAKTGKEFDAEYINEQIDMHQEMLDLLDDLDDDSNTPDVKTAIENAKPNVQAHLDRAKAIKDKLDG